MNQHEPHTGRDWARDAQWARLQQEPVRTRALLYGMVLILAILLLWSAFASLDEVTRGEGRVIPSRQLQVVQSLDGGMVQQILVKEGQTVEAGEVLLRIDPTRSVSSLKESQVQYLSASAEVARLQALLDNTEPVFTDALRRQAPDLVSREQRLYRASQEELQEQLAIYNHQLSQRQQDLVEAQADLKQHTQSLALSRKELRVTRPLLELGAVSDVDILRIEREISRAQGEAERARAAISRSQAAIEEARNKLREVELTVTNRWRREYLEAKARLDALSEAESALADRVQQTEIRAPVRGTIQRLFANTVGGVVAPGREVAELIPLDDELIIEARIQPRDIAFIRPGQSAMIKFTAYDFAIYGGLEAEVRHISADTINDGDGNSYYRVRLATHRSGFARDLEIIPGMVTEVDILTGKKTVLEYLLKPVLRATSLAMTER
ncbi:HlyD family type I secretion periplasmic adaptor subunit [Oceanimonas pelagia]|uniref:Membrane fusion protein (MFP) family protein n=1 Tax=Oceanimonas pelagia TaxID=3028314 RepID=A0AA50KQI6_9GAMM|nr:HlyD family type I secretion periplasmic adaptor subunit [Oceanimonas pelagia]WMC11225.1 HlyD family type I secretion periplasmic adaptor subunit [Oceanimonas pelagia]